MDIEHRQKKERFLNRILEGRPRCEFPVLFPNGRIVLMAPAEVALETFLRLKLDKSSYFSKSLQVEREAYNGFYDCIATSTTETPVRIGMLFDSLNSLIFRLGFENARAEKLGLPSGLKVPELHCRELLRRNNNLYELSFSQDVDRECLKILEAQSTSPTVDFWVRELRSSVKTVLKRKRWNSDCSIFYDQIVASLNQRFVEACKQGKRIGLLKISE